MKILSRHMGGGGGSEIGQKIVTYYLNGPLHKITFLRNDFRGILSCCDTVYACCKSMHFPVHNQGKYSVPCAMNSLRNIPLILKIILPKSN